MDEDTITLALEGEVRLDEFASSMRELSGLIDALTEETAGGAKVIWVIEELLAGSARATVRGISDEPEAIPRIVRAYATVGRSLEYQEPIPFSRAVVERAEALNKVLSDRIPSMRLETPSEEATILRLPHIASAAPRIQYSRGVLHGRVQTLSERGRLRFTLYDSLFDRAISCYLSEDSREKGRDVWGKRVAVSGRIGRDRDTGRPVIIRDVTEIDVFEVNEPGSYKRARGVLARCLSGENSEVIIRRQRDA